MEAHRERHGRRGTRALVAAVGVLSALVVAALMPAVDAADAPAGPNPAGQAEQAAVRVPASPRGLPPGIEALSGYLPQVSCDPAWKPGSIALGNLLRATYPGTSYSVGRDCGADGMASEHYEGRAVDWFVSTRKPVQAGQAQAVLDWLLATDAQGQPYANARRLGVMYVIWNNKIWGAYRAGEGWRPYGSCAATPQPAYDTSCHRDHIHFSLTWAGAMGRTSFWTQQVEPADFGPCRPTDLNWAPPYSTPRRLACPSHFPVSAPAGAPSGYATLVRYSGATVGPGSRGPVVRAVQQGLGLTPDGGYGSVTSAAVSRLQRSAGLPATGRMEGATWRALLAARAGGAAPSKPPTATGTGRPELTRYRDIRLAYGSRGPAVVALQRALGVTPVSGWFGPATRAAVVTFQKSRGLPPIGQVGPATWRALGA